MTLRLKLVIALASLAALSTVAIGVTSYRTAADQLADEVDRSLRQALDQMESQAANGGRRVTILELVPSPAQARPRSFDRILVQVIDGEGEVLASSADTELPVDAIDRRIASGSAVAELTRNIDVDGEPFRQVTSSLTGGTAVQLARSTDEIDRVLSTIRNRTLVWVAVVVGLATLGGWLIAQKATRRLEALTRTAEEVATTGRLDVPTPQGGRDEVGRLGGAVAAMLTALRRSRDAQTQLVQDAGHELRTPLTSLRTNISLLRRFEELPPDAQEQIVADLDDEARELSALVDEIVALATDPQHQEDERPVDLAGLAAAVVERVSRRTGRDIRLEVGDVAPLAGRAGAIERAIHNLVDNAAKFSEPDTTVEVRVEGGTVEVLDRGIGIDATDLPRVFDRFWRAVDARGRPGSGLGLAIVRAVAEDHGGRAIAEPRPGGGTRTALVLPAGDEGATLRT